MKKLLSIILSLLFLGGYAQRLDTIDVENRAFGQNEKLIYKVGYSSFIIGATVAKVVFNVIPEVYNNQPTYKLSANARTTSIFKWFLNLDDTYTVWLDQNTLLPLRFENYLKENSYRYRSSYDYDWANLMSHNKSHNIGRDRRQELTLNLTPQSMDGMSIFYNIRSVKIDPELEEGWTGEAQVVMMDTVYTIKYVFAGYENKKVAGGKFRAIKFTCEFANNTSKGVEIIKFDIWYSDDKNRIPLAMDFPIKGGVMKVTLDEYSGVRFPLDSQLND
jgi:hypothetical protein